ncbi:MAG: NAD(P)H-dependent glycerol-3-phosphate dehydrogenase [Fimbriimonadaceae bacterium]|nr:NAD(P)H-dependent glycerol-3-phosphate dehydrogenase [Fimbriimonadaceae bacterium]
MRATVWGSGSWGTALALLLARNLPEVHLVGRNPVEIARLQTDRENAHYLPGHPLPPNVHCVVLDEAPKSTDLAVIAVPSGAVAEIAARIPADTPRVIIAAKGFEVGTARLLSEVVQAIHPASHIVILSGPNLAIEIARNIPTVAIAASLHESAALEVCRALHSPMFRVAPSADVPGVEVAGALKNVLAIGAGMSDGLGYGDNTKGAFLSRGLLDMAKAGMALGGQLDTFLGPAGVGDLFATAASKLSRNYRFGRAIGEGKRHDDALREIGQVVEGIASCEAAMVLADRHRLDLPVLAAVHQVMHHTLTPMDAVCNLMSRPIRRTDA